MTWYRIFPGILNMSLTAAVIIIFVLLARVLLKKAPKIYSYALWSVVLFRLLCPLSVAAPVSILGILDAPVESRENFNMVEYIPSNIVHEEYPEVNLPLPGVNDFINENLLQGDKQLVADPLEFPITMVTYI